MDKVRNSRIKIKELICLKILKYIQKIHNLFSRKIAKKMNQNEIEYLYYLLIKKLLFFIYNKKLILFLDFLNL